MLLFIFILVPFGYIAGGAYTEAVPRTFDSKSWIAGAKINDDRRCGMLVDLQLRFGLVGKSRSELVKMLGEPQEMDHNNGSSYWLLCTSFGDIWILEIRWKNSHAVEVIVRDT